MLKTVSSITNAIGALNYKGTWNANTNTPTLASGVGTKGDYYQISVAGSTSLDGISNWGVGDVAAFNGTTWQRIEGGADLNGVNLSVSGTSTLDGNVTFKDNFTQNTAGKGVNFTANTPAAGMNSQLLTWYEEGNWTPTVQGSGTAGTYQINTGITKCTYTRVGRLVHVSAYIVLQNPITGGGTGELTVTGLPFPKGNNIAAWGSVAFNNVNYNANANLACYFGGTGSSSTIYFWETNDNAGVTLTPISGVSAGCIIAFSISYEA